MNMLIDGRNIPASDGKTIDVVNPVTNDLVDTIPSATEADIEYAIKCAKKGHQEWYAMPLYERAAVLMKYADLVEEHSEELGKLLAKEMGKPYTQSVMEMYGVSNMFRGFVEAAKHKYDRVNPLTGIPGRDGDFQMVVREPLGVVAAIVPFNVPAGLYGQKVAPALIMGNAVIVKPASDNPLTIIRLVQLLVEAGVPAKAAQAVTGRGGACGTYLSSSPGINGIFFTGSTQVGLEIARMGDLHLTPSFLELGGNDPCIILDDADLDIAIPYIVEDRLFNSGQVCVSPKRLLVQEDIVEEFTARILAEVPKIKVGDPFDPETSMGCLISEKAAIGVEAQVNETIKQGAQLLYGGTRDGAYYMPTILGGITRDMDIANDMEVFGPVFAIIPVKDQEEAISVANQTSYGLSSGIFTKDISRGMTLASKIESGACVINGTGFYITPYQPFGGIKMSGRGREGWSVTLDEVTYEKTITVRNMYKK